jgi:hypothetical protein
MVTNHGIVEYNDKKVVLKVLKEIDDNKVM